MNNTESEPEPVEADSGSAGKLANRQGSINCMVRNLSTSGAALEVSNQIGIPAKFTLVVPQDGLYALQCCAA